MSDLRTVLRALDRPEPVDPDVEERVLAAAAAVLGGRRPPSLRPRLLRGAPALAAAVVLVVTLLAGVAALRGDDDGTRVSSDGTVPFHGTFVTRPTGAALTTTEVWYLDRDHRRIEGPDGLVVTDGEHVLLRGALVDQERPDDPPGSYVRNPYRRGLWPGPLSYADETGCRDPQPVSDATPLAVLGRATRHVRCDTSGVAHEEWIDVATGIVLRTVTDGVVREATSLELDPRRGLDDDRFDTRIPAGAIDANERSSDGPTLGEEIVEGARLASVAGEPVRGEAESLPPEGAWTLVLVTTFWCGDAGCDDGWDTLRSGSHPGVLVVTTDGPDRAGDGEDPYASWTSDVPVLEVGDDLRAWDVQAFPTWIVFDPDGRVADAVAGPLSNLAAVLDAVADGDEPPALRPREASS